MKNIKYVQIGNMGEVYILYEDNTMVQGEMHHKMSDDGKEYSQVEVVKEIKLPTN